MTLLGECILDTLQIYFPWDDDLYTYMKDRGLGSGGLGKKALPLIYTDNCESTVRKTRTRRKFVISPDYFGKTYRELGWKNTGKSGEPIIPAEKIKVKCTLENNNTDLKFRIIPEDKQYHIEYSIRSSFGKIYSNWVALYFNTKGESIFKIYEKLKKKLKYNTNTSADPDVMKEYKQNQREEFDYIEVPLIYYQFSLGEFDYAKDYVKLNGFKGKIPNLFFDSANNKCTKVMTPILKFGIVHTKSNQGFIARNPQIVMKIAQDFITKSKRGKSAKVKGLISASQGENYFLVKVDSFLKSSEKVLELLRGVP